MSNTERITPKSIFGIVEKVSGDKTAKLRIDYTENIPCTRSTYVDQRRYFSTMRVINARLVTECM